MLPSYILLRGGLVQPTGTSALKPSTTSDNSNKQAKYGNINGIPVNNPNETSHPEGNSYCEEPEVGTNKCLTWMKIIVKEVLIVRTRED